MTAPDDILYHYTDCESFLKILDSNCLWASDLETVNDPAELHTTRRILGQALSIYSKGDDLSAGHLKEAPGLRDLPPVSEIAGEAGSDCEHFAGLARGRLDVDGDNRQWGSWLGHVFGVSFCRKSDLLSQWRAYGLNGGGVCIGFDRHLLAGCFRQDVKLVEIKYDAKSQIDRVVEVFREAFQKYKDHKQLIVNMIVTNMDALIAGNIPEEFGKWKEHEWVQESVNDIFRQISSTAHAFKLSAFSEEQEVRLVLRLPADIPDINSVALRARGGKLIPYVELKPMEGCKLPIRIVMFGPTSTAMNQAYALKLMLTRKGYGEVDLNQSEFALRQL